VILTRAIVHIPDVTADAEYDVGLLARVTRASDFRSILAVPMLRDGLPIGTINVHKAESGAFTDKQIALLQIFADQAVSAIENVRLFKELQARTAVLTQSVDKLTAGRGRRKLDADVETVPTRRRARQQLAGGAGCAIYSTTGSER
jgi:GAF domain-containing protein